MLELGGAKNISNYEVMGAVCNQAWSEGEGEGVRGVICQSHSWTILCALESLQCSEAKCYKSQIIIDTTQPIITH